MCPTPRRSRSNCPRQRVPDPPGVPRAPFRDRPAALSADPVRPGHRTRPLHDPAGFLHDETQRGHGDGADLVARLRDLHPFAPLLPSPVTAISSRSWRRGWPRSPATTPCPYSPTPGPRENWPDCWPSGPTTAAEATSSASCPHPQQRPRDQRRQCRHGRDEGVRGQVPRERRCRPRRPADPSETLGDTVAALMITYPSTHGCSRPTSPRCATWSMPPGDRCTSTGQT